MRRRLDSYIVICIGVGMTAAFCFLLLGPQKQDLSALRTSAQTMRSQLARGAGSIAGGSDTEIEIRRISELLAGNRSRITPTADVGAFIEEVSAIATRLKLRDRTIVPQASERRGPITVLPIRISFVSGFSESFSFLRKVESLPRSVRVSELVVERLMGSGGEPVENDGGELRTKLAVKIFYEAT